MTAVKIIVAVACLSTGNLMLCGVVGWYYYKSRQPAGPAPPTGAAPAPAARVAATPR